MPFRFFYAYWLDVGHRQRFVIMENTSELFDLKELLASLKITSGQIENMKGLISLAGLTESRIRYKLRHARIVKSNRFGLNFCLYYILFEDVRGKYLCLFNGDHECFVALFFRSVLVN